MYNFPCFSVYSCSSCSTSWTALCIMLLHTAFKWFILLHSSHHLQYTGHLWGGWLDPQYLHMFVWLCCGLCLYFDFFSDQMALDSWCIFKLFKTTVCVLWASTHHAYISTWLLVTSVFPSLFVSSLIISIIMAMSFSPYINCSLIVYLFLCNCIIWMLVYLPIHSSTFSLCCQTSFWNYSDVTVSLYCSSNILLSVSKRPSSVLHTFCSAWLRASENCRQCLPSQFFLKIGHSLCSAYTIVLKHTLYLHFAVPQLCIFVCRVPIECKLFHA